MANEIVRPAELPPRATPVASEVVPSDNGSVVGGVTWTDGVNAGRPLANQAEAKAGDNAAKAMTPLTTKQAIGAQVPGLIFTAINGLNLGTASQQPVEAFATAAQGSKADTALQSADIGTSVQAQNAFLDALSGMTPGSNGQVIAFDSNGDPVATNAGAGDMLESTYDPASLGLNVFNGIPVATRTALKALPTALFTSAYLTEPGREGQFIWREGDYSAEIAADTQEGVYIKADAIASTSGAWVRAGNWPSAGIDASWFGVVADSDGTTGNGTDNAPSLQAALDLMMSNGIAKINLPQGIIRLGSRIKIGVRSVTISGAGMALTDAWPDPVMPVRSNGTWVYFDHTDIGVRLVATSTNPRFMTRIEHLTTMRNHPTPGPGWTPTVQGADFSHFLHYAHYEDIGFLNPYIAVDANNSVCSFKRIRGQLLHRGFVFEETFDVCRWDDLHLWPYWTLESNVGDYVRANMIVFDFGRIDNPMLSNVFSIRQNVGIRLRASASGATTRLKATNLELDVGGSGLVVEAGANNCIIQLVNFVCFGTASVAESHRAIWLKGDGAIVQVTNLDSENAGAEAVYVEGANNRIGIYNFKATGYGGVVNGSAALRAEGTNNWIHVDGLQRIATAHGGRKFGGVGNIIVDEWRTFTPNITSTSGTITTVSSKVGRYRRRFNSVDFYVEATITDNGTGGGELRVTLPFACITNSVVFGMNTTNGHSMNGVVGEGNSHADFKRYDGTYPVASGLAVRVYGTYRV